MSAIILLGGMLMFNNDTSAEQNNPESMSQNIVNSPGAQAYQAGRDMYINPAKQQRHLTSELQRQLINGLPSNKEDTIVIKYTSNDTEAYQYANEFKSFLESEGWTVKGPHSAMFFSKEPRKGVNVAPPKNGEISMSIYAQ
jgi:hypothetical protein